MSVFSDLLSEYITMKDVGVYPLSQFCGLDRSSMYKIINGKRTPAGEDVVRKMAQFMQLTPQEKTDFMDAFYIAQMGAEVYYRRKAVGELIETFSRREGRKEHIFSEMEVAQLELNGGGSGATPFQGAAHVRHAILQLFSGEAVKENGEISVLVQPDFDFAMELLQALGEQNLGLTIRHLFCMNNNEKLISMRKNYNLSCLQKILPICACGCDYRAWYYYDNVAARLNEFRLFPYLILTEHCALVFSADYQNAILFREEEMLRMMREMFEQYLRQSDPLFERLDTVQTQLGYTETLIQHFIESNSPRYFFQRMPCFSGLLTGQMLERHLVPEMPMREQMVQAVARYAKVMQSRVLDKKTTMFFSEDGVRNFLETGRVDEYPRECYSPLDMEERVDLVRKFLALREQTNLRMMKDAEVRAKHTLNISVNAHEGYLLFQTKNERLIYLSIQEPSVLTAFYDYLESMKPEHFCTEEEMLARMDRLLDEFVSCHSDAGSI